MEPKKTLDSQDCHDQKEQFWKDYHPTIQDILYSIINKKVWYYYRHEPVDHWKKCEDLR